jgi:hypothetical protein
MKTWRNACIYPFLSFDKTNDPDNSASYSLCYRRKTVSMKQPPPESGGEGGGVGGSVVVLFVTKASLLLDVDW